MMDDLISRQAAIDAVIEITYDQTALHHGWVDPYYVVNRLEYLPSADLSEYCDKLWKTAYERGKAETIIRCDECEHWDIEWIPAAGEGHYCPMMDHVMIGDEWCCYGVRRMSDG